MIKQKIHSFNSPETFENVLARLQKSKQEIRSQDSN